MRNQSIDKANELLHDESFSLEKISFVDNILNMTFLKKNMNRANVLKSFYFFKLIEYPIEEVRLKILNCKSFVVDDTEGINSYGFNYLEYLDNENKISIHTIPNIKFDVFVTFFDIKVEFTNRIVKWRKRFS